MASRLPSQLPNFSRGEFEDTCKRRFFFGLGFEPYGGTSGLYDLGPPMCAMKTNLLSFWRQHFVLEENMCEVDTSCLTPEEVFKASGHVVRFNDVMVRDTVTGECIRADKYVEEFCDQELKKTDLSEERVGELRTLQNQVGGMNTEQLAAVIAAHKLKSPKGNTLSEPFPFNLMFSTQIGPEGDRVGYMRPELAQGIILNFKRLMDSGNAQRMPFAGACIGTAFRNEIAPRQNLIRVREFTLAEIEHFMNPNDKRHDRFDKVRHVRFLSWSRDLQAENKEPELITIGDAVDQKIVDNETLAYFIARVALFLEAIGVKYYRFRQHHRTEMSHYAQDCWDAELLTSYGWVECVGIADRSAYDLTQHSRASKKDLCAREEFQEAVIERQLQRKLQKGVIGKEFGKTAGQVVEYINSLTDAECNALGEKLAAGAVGVTLPSGQTVNLTPAMVQFEYKDVKVTGRNYTPSVVEPSFGVGRILYCLLEQSYWVRRDEGAAKDSKNEKRAVFSLSPVLAPQKVAVLPLLTKPELLEIVERLRAELVARGVSTRTDDSAATIGKKYARTDELGIPFCITCDFENDGAVTVRERDSARQVRVPVDKVAELIYDLCRPVNSMRWEEVEGRYPAQSSTSATS